MNIIAVDDEQNALNALTQAIEQAVPAAGLLGCTRALDALAYAKSEKIDVAFLDIHMREMDGLQLAKALIALHPRINIIFVTGYGQHTGAAFDLHASGYVRKPVRASAVKMEMEILRFKPKENEPPRVHIRCFGSFAVFVNDQPLVFTRAKPKELLAYLVHQNGAFVSGPQIAAILWEDKEYNDSLRSQVRTVLHRLLTVLKEAGVEDIVLKEWNSTSINTGKVSCDYYEYLKNGHACAHTFHGEYLPDYSWAEATQAFLNRRAARTV